MASIRAFSSHLGSRDFLSGVVSGLVLGAGAFYLYAEVRVRMGSSGPPGEAHYLDPVEVPILRR